MAREERERIEKKTEKITRMREICYEVKIEKALVSVFDFEITDH